MPSQSNGVLESISVKEGETVNVGALLGMINGASTKDSSESRVKKYSPQRKNKLVKKKEQQSSKKVSTQPVFLKKKRKKKY